MKRERDVLRAHFSAITDTDIKAAMRNLGKPNKLESLAVDARQELDLRIGCAFTRFQTKFFQGKYGDLDSGCISYGPCQTPTLVLGYFILIEEFYFLFQKFRIFFLNPINGFCVERHDQIAQFKPEKYWRLSLGVKTPGMTLQAEWHRGRVFDQQICNLFFKRLKGHKEAKVEKVQKKQKAKQRPQALNTVELLRVCSAKLGIGPAQAMVVAERLYTQGSGFRLLKFLTFV